MHAGFSNNCCSAVGNSASHGKLWKPELSIIILYYVLLYYIITSVVLFCAVLDGNRIVVEMELRATVISLAFFLWVESGQTRLTVSL